MKKKQAGKVHYDLKLGNSNIPIKEPFSPWALLGLVALWLICFPVMAALHSAACWAYSGTSVLGIIGWVSRLGRAKSRGEPD